MRKHIKRTHINGNRRLKYCSYISMGGVRIPTPKKKIKDVVSIAYLKLVGCVLVVASVVEYYINF